MDPNIDIDIFRDLDASFIELFHRAQLQTHLEHLPPTEREEQLNNLLSQRDLLNSHHHQQTQYYHIHWIFSYVPFIILNFDQIWRDFSWRAFWARTVDVVTSAMIMAVRALRFTTFIIGSGVYFQGVVRRLFVFCDVITFSDNFIRDMFTYILRDSQDILDQCILLERHSRNVFYFLQYDEYNDLSSLQVLQLAYRNLLASLINVECITYSPNSTGTTTTTSSSSSTATTTSCKILTDTLVFKLSSVFQDFFPALGSTGLKLITLWIYISYALIGDIVCLNILLFVSYNLINRFMGYKQMFQGLKDILWNSLFKFIL
ncbi:conserved hypothetical protein [Candida dubliniensis CD36]|uniref:Uncharacterized protein n=1 Tax=Candida dubliniensis (strain CD36 / ATCC MYA-646 / CBS 7987 / NCPF 3949 / NRRL Y-17841) TaxID=573826 RepID=B9WHI7_CANDC|nr:conserved hypothetical protein [Candida dubliniensis CD36]CAX41629.1 conserved hypothetical protein [Candida dubliniensis CD36]